MPEPGSDKWPFNLKNDSIDGIWSYAYCPGEDTECPTNTVKQDESIINNLEELTRDLIDQPLTCLIAECGDYLKA